jgi:hypothetical protein
VCSKADRALKREIAKRERDANPELVRARARRKYQRSHARQLERATRYRYPWTGPELELAARPDLSHAQVAEMIGRTGAAVKHMRRKLQYDPKIINLAGVASDHRA